MDMASSEERYRKLMVEEALSINHLYPLAIHELSSILYLLYDELPKKVQALIFRDILTAFRLLPDVNTSAGVSAANLLIKKVETILPKQKKNIAIGELKQAKVTLKRRNKNREEDRVCSDLPQDILIQIFSFLDVVSLVNSSQVSRSWKQAASDNTIWQTQYEIHFNHKSFISNNDWRESFKKAHTKNPSMALRYGRGYCIECESIVWHENLRCGKKECRLKTGNRSLNLVTTQQVINYLSSGSLLAELSSDESDESDDEHVGGLWAFSYPIIYTNE